PRPRAPAPPPPPTARPPPPPPPPPPATPTPAPRGTPTTAPGGTSTTAPGGTSTTAPGGTSTTAPAGTSTTAPAGTSTTAPTPTLVARSLNLDPVTGGTDTPIPPDLLTNPGDSAAALVQASSLDSFLIAPQSPDVSWVDIKKLKDLAEASILSFLVEHDLDKSTLLLGAPTQNASSTGF
ncbi:MAG: hypothetical protein KY448_17235, partial [Cyanobacteria bacterium 0813]|nr:hypothetical protein [Cyanobacteria bacterium 0813]